MMAKKRAPTWLPQRALSKVSIPKGSCVQRRSFKLKNKDVDADPTYKSKPITISDGESDKSIEAIAPLVTTKAKKLMPQVP